MDLAGLISALAAAVSAAAAALAVISTFGRRHRLKLAIEVRNGIPNAQRGEWDRMIERDAKGIIDSSRSPRLGIGIYLLGFAFSVTGAYATMIPIVWRARVTLASWVLLPVSVIALIIHYLSRYLELKKDRNAVEQMQSEDSQLDASRRILLDSLSVKAAWISAALYTYGAPLRTVVRAQAAETGPDGTPSPAEINRLSWRIRRTFRRFSRTRKRLGWDRYDQMKTAFAVKHGSSELAKRAEQANA